MADAGGVHPSFDEEDGQHRNQRGALRRAQARKPPDQKGSVIYHGFGFTFSIPLPKWAVAVLAAMVIIAIAGVGLFLAKTKFLDVNKVEIPKTDLIAYQEASKHQLESSDDRVQFDNKVSDSLLITTLWFKSDGCLETIRSHKSPNGSEAVWLYGPNVRAVNEPGKRLTRAEPQDGPETAADLDAKVSASAGNPGVPLRFSFDLAAFKIMPVFFQRGCLNPHPGRWAENRQQTNQCMIQVFRTFEDSCSHFQLFNVCTNSWDVLPNGAPNVHWTRCIH